MLPEGPSILFPVMDPARGRALFVEKGCIVCHSVNGVGGEVAPALDAAGRAPFANPFDFAASMWRGAEAMIELQKRSLGYQIEITGGELADIIGFVHDGEEQRRLTPEDVPPNVLRLMPFERL